MKAIFVILLALLPLVPVCANDVPALKAGEAAAIAQADLESRGLDSTVFIAEVVFKKPGPLGGGAPYWEVLWSKPFDAQTEGRKEVGLRIGLDGSYSRSVR
jgi:hypothetical protein